MRREERQHKEANALRAEWAKNDALRDAGVEAAKSIRIVSDLVYAAYDRPKDKKWHLTDIYFPEEFESDKYPVIVSVHGGGWFYGDKELYNLYTKYLASLGFAVFNFNYRLGPEYKYPATFTDVCYLMDFVAKNAEAYKLDLDRVYMVGDSAGAQLVSQYSVYASSSDYRDLFNSIPELEDQYKNSEIEVLVPKRVALNCGVYQMDYAEDKMVMDWYMPDATSEALNKSLYNILDYVNSDFPETYLMASVNDGLRPRTMPMKEKLEEMKVSFIYKDFGFNDKNDGHVFHVNMRSEDGKLCNAEQAAFFNGMLNPEKARIDILEAIKQRHSVRAYTDQVIEDDVRDILDELVEDINAESGLHIQIRYDDPAGFDSKLAHYGRFRNVNNYIVLAGDKDEDIEEKCGYYGEKLVIEAQRLGLNTCWVALTFNKKMVKTLIPDGEKLCMVIALGYGENQGVERKSKTVEQVTVSKGHMPKWFRDGAEAALLAPTAVNQQKFKMGVKDGEPLVLVDGRGVNTKVDLGIVKYHFEVASGRKVR